MKKLFAKGLIAAGLIAASSAHAAVITEWSYVNEAGFLDVDPVEVSKLDFQAANVLSQDTYKKLEWGVALDGIDERSSLSVDSPQSSDDNGNIMTVGTNATLTDSDFAVGTGLTHNNYPVGGISDKWLKSATLLDGIQLSAAAWNLPGVPSGIMGSGPELQIAFDFYETKNAPQSGVCPDGSIPGTDINAADFGCDDYFILNSDFAGGLSDLVVDPVNDTLFFSVVFDLLDGAPQAFVDFANDNDLITKYEITTKLTGFEVTTDFCGDDGVPPCLALKTEENAVNQLTAGFAIRAVPEPAAIAVLGLGLLGLASVRRRRNS